MPDPEELALALFAIFNGARVIAYIPQILLIRKDRQGAAAVSCTTWTLFALSHLSTAIYAAIVSHDATVAVAFVANAAGCTVIVALASRQRRLFLRSRTASFDDGTRSSGWLARTFLKRTARSAAAQDSVTARQALP